MPDSATRDLLEPNSRESVTLSLRVAASTWVTVRLVGRDRRGRQRVVATYRRKANKRGQLRIGIALSSATKRRLRRAGIVKLRAEIHQEDHSRRVVVRQYSLKRSSAAAPAGSDPFVAGVSLRRGVTGSCCAVPGADARK